MNLRARVEKSPIIFFLTTLLGGYLAGLGTYGGLLVLTGQQSLTAAEIRSQVTDLVAKEMSIWEFTRPLYEGLPKDIDFLVRNIRISLSSGDSVTVVGPGASDSYNLSFSEVHKQSEGNWSAVLQIDGRMGDNDIRNLLFPMVIKRGIKPEPMNALSHQLYAIVEDVDPDGIVNLALARRKIQASIQGNLVFDTIGSPLTVQDVPPEAIVRRRGQN